MNDGRGGGRRRRPAGRHPSKFEEKRHTWKIEEDTYDIRGDRDTRGGGPDLNTRGAIVGGNLWHSGQTVDTRGSFGGNPMTSKHAYASLCMQ